MDYLLKQKRAKIEEEAERLFGNDTLLKTVYVMTEMNTPQEEVDEVTTYLRNEAEDLAKEIETKMFYRYDLSGNLVPVIEEDIQNISN
jgi:flagellar motor switch protein FliG